MGFNSGFKGLTAEKFIYTEVTSNWSELTAP